jgi:hypothetical protein
VHIHKLKIGVTVSAYKGHTSSSGDEMCRYKRNTLLQTVWSGTTPIWLLRVLRSQGGLESKGRLCRGECGTSSRKMPSTHYHVGNRNWGRREGRCWGRERGRCTGSEHCSISAMVQTLYSMLYRLYLRMEQLRGNMCSCSKTYLLCSLS